MKTRRRSQRTKSSGQTARPKNSATDIWTIFLIVAIASTLGMTNVATASNRTNSPRILLVVPGSAAAPFSQAFVYAFTDFLSKDYPETIIEVEAVPLGPSDEAAKSWALSRVAGRSVDAIVAFGATAVRAIESTNSVRTRTPMVALDFNGALRNIEPGKTAPTIIEVQDTAAPTFELGGDLFPAARNWAVIATSLSADPFRPTFGDTLSAAAKAKGARIIDLSGQTLDELRISASRLPKDTVVFLFGPVQDKKGRWILPRSLLAAIKENADLPVMSDMPILFGHGNVGGSLVDPEILGKTAAQMVTRRLRGEHVGSVEELLLPTRIDWREIQKHGGVEAGAPNQAIMEFRERSLWEQHRWAIMLASVVILIQSLLVLRLMLERWRRRQAENEARQRLVEVAHYNRIGQVSQLSLSVAHDLNQPLGAILANAQTCEILLERPSSHPDELRTLLKRIIQANTLASGIVQNLRDLASKEPTDLVQVEVDNWVQVTATLLAPDIRNKGIACELDLDAPDAVILANNAQLQQILINLLLNSMEAMEETAPEARLLRISTRMESETTVCIQIEDRGPGLPKDSPERIFESFYSTKDNGLGIGLSISRKLVETLGGSLIARDNQHGACFEWRMPLHHRGHKSS